MEKKVAARCQASCGELIQGIINGKELIVSCPIDMYSYAYVTIEKNGSIYRKKAKEAVLKTILYLGESPKLMDHISVNIESEIPIGKGMGSSTADIAATSKAVAALLGYDIGCDDIAKIAVSIEPTDSTMFDQLTLFDSRGATVVEKIGDAPDLWVIVLEGNDTVDTVEFHKNRRTAGKPLDGAYELLKRGIKGDANVLLGEASLISAKNSQNILPKPYFDFIVENAMNMGAVGVNVAHTGSSIGVLINEHNTDVKKIQNFFTHSAVSSYYKIYTRKMIQKEPEVI